MDWNAALRKIGAEFPPSDQDSFEAHLNLGPFESLLGAIHLRQVQFRWSDARTLPLWTVELEGKTVFETKCYRLDFEPMHGRLVGFGRHPCNK